MAGAGKYYDRYSWLLNSKTRERTYGQHKDRYSPNGSLWGYSEELTGGEQIAYAARQAQTTARIHIRNYPDLLSADRLIDQWGNYWHIDSIQFGDNELICDVHRFEVLNTV